MKERIDRFIRDTSEIADTASLIRYFEAVMAEIGFPVSSYHYIARQFRRIELEDGFRAANFPTDWVDRYLDQDYFEIDPIMEEARRRPTPFYWFDVDVGPEQSQKRALLADLRTAGFSDGIAVPVFVRQGDIAYFGLSAPGERINLSDAQLLELQILCQHMHMRFNQLAREKKSARLSPRELQVLALLVQGQSNARIAEALALSSHTVDTLVRRCFQKLEASNRIEAALAGVSQGLVLA